MHSWSETGRKLALRDTSLLVWLSRLRRACLARVRCMLQRRRGPGPCQGREAFPPKALGGSVAILKLGLTVASLLRTGGLFS